MYPISLIYLAKQGNSWGLQEILLVTRIHQYEECVRPFIRSRGLSPAEPKRKLGTTYSFSLKAKSQKKHSFSWFLVLKSWRKRNFASFEFSAHDFPPRIIDVESWYAHILFVLKENPSRRVNLTPLSAHDWKTRTPSSWSKQCSTRFQISLLESCDKKQLFF